MSTEEKILLQIVTPYKMVVDEYVDEVRIPGSEGQLGVLYGHTPLLTSLQVGEVLYKSGAKEDLLCVSGGFAEVLNNKVTLLVETAEIAHEIDIARASTAKERAEAKLKGDLASEQEYVDTHTSLKKAVTRITVGSKLIK